MTSRGHPPPPTILRHGPALGSGSSDHYLADTRLPPELAEKKLVVEIERLASENHKLATVQVILRRDLVTAQEEVQRVKAHIRSIQTESDIQIRVLLEKIAKMEADFKDGANLKKELEQAHKEAQKLVVVRQELVDEIEKANKELGVARSEIKQLPNMLSELDSMKEDHSRLCASFEYEKHFNIKKVEQLQAMERELIGMAREVERLRAEVSDAEKALQTPPPTTVPYGFPYPNMNPSLSAPAIQSNGPYYDPYGMPSIQMGAVPVDGMISYANSSIAPPPPAYDPPPAPPPPASDPPVTQD